MCHWPLCSDMTVANAQRHSGRVLWTREGGILHYLMRVRKTTNATRKVADTKTGY